MAGQVVASGAMDPNPLHSKVIPLYVSSAHHHWGRSVESSLAARLKSLNKLSALSPDNPPSQLILSTTAPNEAILATTPSVTLFDYIQSQVIEVHPDIVDFYAALHRDGLPYQLSIISVAHPQPLRVNPSYDISKRLAEQLSFSSPLAKTVMLVSLSDSQVLFGFQAASEIVSELSRVPEFADAVGRPETDRFVHTVKTSTATPNDVKVIMSSLMLRDAQVIANCLLSASKRLQKMPPEAVTENDKLLITLQEVYPNDPACFAVYFLNSIYMKPGQAVFIQPQEPYSILNGELIEVTNNSDAIVYGGLSKSSAQTEVFLKSLSFDDSPVEVRSQLL